MASTNQSLHDLAQVLSTRVRVLVNADLKEICRKERLAVSGIKAVLQRRIVEHIEAYERKGDAARLEILRYRIENRGKSPPPRPPASGAAPQVTNPAPSRAYPTANGYPRPNVQATSVMRQPTFATGLLFKESPFFEVKEPLTHPLEMIPMPANRQTVQTSIILTPTNAERLSYDKSLRIMLYCSADTGLGPYTRSDIAFPQQLEVKVNNGDVKANFKGLKNKPGSTRPADITDLVRKTAGYSNHISVTYALTTKKFHLVVQLVKKHSVEELTQRIRTGRVISRQVVINELVTKANDPDIVATSTVMSLKDPISTLRIQLPCRSTVCSHNQCFDASYFLQLQEQAPTWICPVCSKTISFEAIAVDQYVEEILRSVPSSTDQVTIEPNGTWSQTSPADVSRSHNGSSKASGFNDDNDSDDLVEITDHRITTLKTEAINTPPSFNNTPPLSSREASLSHSAPRPMAGSKRTSEVVDLTLSDDDDEEPVRPAKRPAYGTPYESSDPMRGGAGTGASAGGGVRVANGPTAGRPNGIAPFRLGQPPHARIPSQLPSPNMLPQQAYMRPSHSGYGSSSSP